VTPTWQPESFPAVHKISTIGWCRAILRTTALAVVTFSCLLILIVIRVVERPFFGLHRPATAYIPQFVCRTAMRIFGIRLHVQGVPMREKGAVVANHSSWLDIFVLNARKRIYYVSKSEIANWPAIGPVAKAAGTVFIDRDPRQAVQQKAIFVERLKAGHRLLFFPEGTSTDGQRVLPFKPTLFQAFFEDGLQETMCIQPVSVIYTSPAGEPPEFYGWYGGMDFAPSLLKILSVARQGRVDLIYHEPLRVADFAGRKQLALAAEQAVREGVLPRLAARSAAVSPGPLRTS
jgi:1-acyl-sn-glycerol-3-phosphate acyltransferase